MSNNYQWELALNKDESLYFFPLSHKVEGVFTLHFELSGSYSLIVSDADFAGRPVLLLQYIDEDNDRPASIGIIEAETTIESMIEHLNKIDSIYHEPIYRSVYEWALKLFS